MTANITAEFTRNRLAPVPGMLEQVIHYFTKDNAIALAAQIQATDPDWTYSACLSDTEPFWVIQVIDEDCEFIACI